jgi:squalene-associated FAD-dependent desaturase
MPRTIHIVGAGLAGLSAAVQVAKKSKRVVLYEAQANAGGRCRSYYDHATDLVIDNGNHLLLSGNRAALRYLETIGGNARLIGPDRAVFDFVDLSSSQRWTLRIGDGRLPAWIFDPDCRIPGTRAFDYLGLARLLWAAPGKTVCEVIPCEGVLHERLVRPLLLAALNIEPREGSAHLARAVLRETLAKGGANCRPLIAREGLSNALIEPALAYLRAHNVEIRFRHELGAMAMDADGPAALDFGVHTVDVARDDAVILAIPAPAAAGIVPGLQAPTEFRATLNGHFRIDPPPGFPPLMGVVNGLVEWIFAFPNRLSITISAADRLMAEPREELARRIWREVATVVGLDAELPSWQIVRERRATFAASPAEDAKRPQTRTRWRNLFLAGDWTQTGLPATIEGAIRSGERAAALALVL